MVNTLQYKGCVKRKHRHILNVAQTLRFKANLPPLNFVVNVKVLVKYCLAKLPLILIFSSLGVYVMHTIDLDKKTSLVIEVENVFLWDILMGKMGGISTIWMLENILNLVMLCFAKMSFLS
ncbi:hypothetical protein CR513_46735, partial [Mucuna pruriens]